MSALDHDPLIDSLLRPKPLAPKPSLEARATERLRRERVMAVAFGVALDEAGMSNVECAKRLSVSEGLIRDFRSRKARLTAVHVFALPEELRDALFRKASELLKLADELPSVPELLRARPSNDDFDR